MTTPQKERKEKKGTETASEARIAAVRREVLWRLQRDEVLVDRLVQEMDACVASPSGCGESQAVDTLATGTAVKEKSNRESMKAVMEQFLRQQGRVGGTSGSNLLGELKQVMDLESIVVRRCWELMEEEWFDEILSNTS